ncbi:unnamed protein product [Prunus armeniaca]
MLWSELIQGTSVRCQCMSDLLALSTSFLTHMEDISSAFSHRFVLTDVEQQEIVIESKENIGVKTDKFFLVGAVLSDKPVNKEALRKTFYAIWKPKAHVTIVELEQNRFFFAFNTNLERATILNGGPWLFNGYLLILAEANEKVNPTRIPLVMQEFWIQVKGLPLSFMTRAMGQMIGTALGGYVVTDQSKKVDCLGSYLRIRARIDVTKPLRRSLNLRLDGDLVEMIRPSLMANGSNRMFLAPTIGGLPGDVLGFLHRRDGLCELQINPASIRWHGILTAVTMRRDQIWQGEKLWGKLRILRKIA